MPSVHSLPDELFVASLPEARARVTKPFVLVGRDSSGVLFVSDQARRVLSRMPGSALRIMGIAGPMREGKSAIANLLVTGMAGDRHSFPSFSAVFPRNTLTGLFEASDSGEPVTIGVNAVMVLPLDGSGPVLVLDTEGMGEEAAERDARIVLVACMLSSCFILNRKGAVGRQAIISDMEVLANAGSTIARVAARAAGADAAPREGALGAVTVLQRDYSLRHTAEEVEAKIFDDEASGDAGADSRNASRKTIRTAWSDRAAVLLPHPRDEDMDAAIADRLFPRILSKLAEPTVCAITGEHVTARSLPHLLAAVIERVNDESFADLVPGDVLATMRRARVAELSADIVADASAVAAAGRDAVTSRRGVSSEVEASMVARVRGAAESRIALLADGCDADIADDIREATAEAVEAAVAGLSQHCAGLGMAARERMQTELSAAVRARVEAAADISEATRTAVGEVEAALSLADIDAIAAPTVGDAEDAIGASCLEAVRAAVVEGSRADVASSLGLLDAAMTAAADGEAMTDGWERSGALTLAQCVATAGEDTVGACMTADDASAMAHEIVDSRNAEAADLVEASRRERRAARERAIAAATESASDASKEACRAMTTRISDAGALTSAVVAAWRTETLAAAMTAARAAVGPWVDADEAMSRAETDATERVDAVAARNRDAISVIQSRAKSAIAQLTSDTAHDEALAAMRSAFGGRLAAVKSAANVASVDARKKDVAGWLASYSHASPGVDVGAVVQRVWDASSDARVASSKACGGGLDDDLRGAAVESGEAAVKRAVTSGRGTMTAQLDAEAATRRTAVTPPPAPIIRTVHHHHKKGGCAVM